MLGGDLDGYVGEKAHGFEGVHGGLWFQDGMLKGKEL